MGWEIADLERLAPTKTLADSDASRELPIMILSS